MSWEKIRFSDIYSENSKNGISVNKAQHNGTVKIVNMGELFANDFIGDIDMRRIKVEDTQLRRFSLTEGDLLFARRSLVAEGAGKVAMVESVTEPTVFESSIIRVRLDPRRALPRFYEYWFNSFEGHDAIARLITGTNVKGVRSSELRNITVPLPPLNVQQGIAGILFTYDKLIENNRRQIKLLEEAAQRLYKEWFVDLRFPGHETTPIHNGVPEGWKRTTVGQSSSLVSRGVTPAYADDSNELVLGQRCVRNNLVDLSFARHHKPKKPNEKWLKKWDVLINSTGTGSLGRTAQFWLDNNNVVVDSHITIIRAQQREVAAYLGQWAFSNEAMLEALHTGSTGQTELPRDRVANCHILIPDNDLLDLFYTLIEPMTMRIVAAQQQIVAAREARDRLLPKLMSGEIEV